MTRKSIRNTILGLALAAALTLTYAATEPGPGYVDFGKLPAASGGDLVEVSISRPLLAVATQLVRTQEPAVAELLKGIHHVRVNVVSLKDDNRATVMESVAKVRSGLAGAGWENVVNVKSDKEDVGVSIKLKGEEAVEGLLISVIEGGNTAILVNIVGNIRPDQVAALADRLEIDALKKVGGKIAEIEKAEGAKAKTKSE